MHPRLVLKNFVRRPGTRRALRNVKRSIDHLWTGLRNELKHGQDLKNYCRNKTEILLNIGCGDLIKEGWINIDFQPRSGAFYFNALNPLPIEEKMVAHIHAEHFLEHLEYSDAIAFLRECRRVLEIGGTMRIVVPDAERYMHSYVGNDTSFFGSLKNLGGVREPFPTKNAICNQMFRMGGDHHFAWDFETLEYVTRQIGFKAIQKSIYNDSSVAYCIDGHDWWRPVESLYVNLAR